MDIGKWVAAFDTGADEILPSAGVTGRLVYGPQGQIKYIRIGPGLCRSTAGIVYWDEAFKRFMINPVLAEQNTNDEFPAWGWYEQLCQATDSMHYYEKAKSYHDKINTEKLAGRPRPKTPKKPGRKTERDPEGIVSGHRPTPPDWYHPIIEARRKSFDGGSPIMEFPTAGEPAQAAPPPVDPMAAFDDVDTSPDSA